MSEKISGGGRAMESLTSESAPEVLEAADQTEHRIREETSRLQRFRSGKTWKAARALLLVSFLGAGGSYYKNQSGEDTDKGIEPPTTTERLTLKEHDLKEIRYNTEAEYRDMLKHNVGGILQDANLFKKEPWAEKLIKESVDAALERAPDYVLRHADRFKDYPWGMEKIRAAVESNKTYYGDVLEYAESYKNEPWAEAKIKKDVEKSITEGRRDAVIYAQNYIHQSWGPELLKKAVQARLKYSPVSTLEEAKYYRTQPWGSEMLKTAVRETLNKGPWALLKYIDSYKSEPWAPEFLKMAVERTIETDAKRAVGHAEVYKDNPEWGKEKLRQAVEKAFMEYPVELIWNSKKYREEPWGEAKLKESVEWAIEHDVGASLHYTEYYKGETWGKDAVRKAVLKASTSNPRSVLQYGYLVQDDPWVLNKCREVFDQAFKQDDFVSILYSIKPYLEQPWAKKELERTVKKAAVTDPNSAIADIQLYRNEPYAGEVIVTALKRDPLQTFRYEIEKEISKSSDPFLRILSQIRKSDHERDVQRNMVVLIDEIAKGEITIEQSAEIAQDPTRLFQEVLKIKAQPNPLGEVSLETWFKNFSLRSIREINNLHERPDAERFKSVEKASAEALYTLMVYGEEEVFTSTFGGLFNRLLKEMKEERISGGQLLDKTHNLRFRSFVRLTAGFNKLNEFLNTMDSADGVVLLKKFAQNIERERNPLSQAVAVADVFSTVQDTAILKVFQETIRQEYERVQAGQDKNAQVIYGLLAGMFSKKSVINEDWTREIAKQYKLPDVMEIPSADLFNRDGFNVQRYFFYNDEDGHASYAHFLAQYKDTNSWALETKDSYILITSKAGNKKIQIYANKPSKEDEGQEAITKVFAERKLESIMVVHRGHSYHVDKTIQNIPLIAKIVSLGSCGGYNNMDAVLKMAPGAHIISTKGTGTMSVNDPLFKMINDKISRGQSLNWPTIWKEAEQKLGSNKDFDNYVPPHKNLGVLFLKAYNQLKKD
ncbi:MAG: hypothetical protein Q8L52_00435 [bacterium]|nr:hypothetical protein [bacterium]